MAQQVRVLAARPEDMSAIPGSYRVKMRTDFCWLSSDLHTHPMASEAPPKVFLKRVRAPTNTICKASLFTTEVH